MSDTSAVGVLYTEHSGLAATTPVASLWLYVVVWDTAGEDPTNGVDVEFKIAGFVES